MSTKPKTENQEEVGNGKCRLNISLDAGLREKLEWLAVEDQRSATNMMEKLIADEYRRRKLISIEKRLLWEDQQMQSLRVAEKPPGS
jgi:predicted transcriptional regulator